VRSDSSLAGEQAALVAALVRGETAREGFDETRLRALSEMLRGKRRKAVARSCPELPRALGEGFASTFDEYGRVTHSPTGAGAIDDASRFLGWLSHRGLLPRELRFLALTLRLRRLLRTVAFSR
jgi:hypothetical protein